MPRAHRELLLHLERSCRLRDYVASQAGAPDLTLAYNDAVAALTGLRDTHLQIVARYIVMPSRTAPAPWIAQWKGSNLATACSSMPGSLIAQELHGTGGTSVVPFLKRTRDETRSSVIAPR
jgi:indoleamine 2,3-dioxygenase